jgi:hypothetical protein
VDSVLEHQQQQHNHKLAIYLLVWLLLQQLPLRLDSHLARRLPQQILSLVDFRLAQQANQREQVDLHSVVEHQASQHQLVSHSVQVSNQQQMHSTHQALVSLHNRPVRPN